MPLNGPYSTVSPGAIVERVFTMLPDTNAGAITQIPGGWQSAKIVATAAGAVLVKNSPGDVALVTVVDSTVTIYIQDGTSQAWTTSSGGGTQDFSNHPIHCSTSIQLYFSAAGTAWILYR